MRALTARKAFLRSLPVMAGYVVLGMGFGILSQRVGYGLPWALAMSVLVFAGSGAPAGHHRDARDLLPEGYDGHVPALRRA